MTVASEIARLQAAKVDIMAALVEKGVDVTGKNLVDVPDLIDSIAVNIILYLQAFNDMQNGILIPKIGPTYEPTFPTTLNTDSNIIKNVQTPYAEFYINQIWVDNTIKLGGDGEKIISIDFFFKCHNDSVYMEIGGNTNGIIIFTFGSRFRIEVTCDEVTYNKYDLVVDSSITRKLMYVPTNSIYGWHHIALVRNTDESIKKLYLDGELILSTIGYADSKSTYVYYYAGKTARLSLAQCRTVKGDSSKGNIFEVPTQPF